MLKTHGYDPESGLKTVKSTPLTVRAGTPEPITFDFAQTEGMIAMADAAEGAARSLDIPMTKVWMCSGLKNSRESHLAVDGMEVEMDEPFILAGGELMYPHDTSLGADAGEIINCACSCGYRPK